MQYKIQYEHVCVNSVSFTTIIRGQVIGRCMETTLVCNRKSGKMFLAPLREKPTPISPQC